MSVTKAEEYPFETREETIAGRAYRFRELSVEENDECSDQAKDEHGLINGRIMMRLMIVTSALEPKITPDLLAKMPQRVYLKICDLVNSLNDPDTLDKKPDDGKGNG